MQPPDPMAATACNSLGARLIALSAVASRPGKRMNCSRARFGNPCAVIHRADVRDEQGGTRRVVAIGAPGYRAAESAAYPLIDGCACGLDMTRRDPRRVARRNGWPRGLGQDIEQGSAISAIVPVHGVVIERGEAALTVNGQPR
jgi:hypothetical protein